MTMGRYSIPTAKWTSPREYDGKTQTTVLELPDDQLRTKLCDLLKGARNKQLR